MSEFNGRFILVNVNTEEQKELAKKTLDEPENVKLVVTLGRLLLIDEQHDAAYQILKSLPDELQNDAEINALIVHLELNQAASNISSMEQITEAMEKIRKIVYHYFNTRQSACLMMTTKHP